MSLSSFYGHNMVHYAGLPLRNTPLSIEEALAFETQQDPLGWIQSMMKTRGQHLSRYELKQRLDANGYLQKFLGLFSPKQEAGKGAGVDWRKLFFLLKGYYPELTQAGFLSWSLFDLEQALETIKELEFRRGYPNYALLNSFQNAFRGKDAKVVDFVESLPAFAKPDGLELVYRKAFAVTVFEAFEGGSMPSWAYNLLEHKAVTKGMELGL